MKLRALPLSESQMSALENEENDGGHHVGWRWAFKEVKLMRSLAPCLSLMEGFVVGDSKVGLRRGEWEEILA